MGVANPLLMPERFKLYAQTIGQAVDVGIIARYLVDVENIGVAEAGGAQGGDIGLLHGPRFFGELLGVGEHGAVGGVQIGLPPVRS